MEHVSVLLQHLALDASASAGRSCAKWLAPGAHDSNFEVDNEEDNLDRSK